MHSERVQALNVSQFKKTGQTMVGWIIKSQVLPISAGHVWFPVGSQWELRLLNSVPVGTSQSAPSSLEDSLKKKISAKKYFINNNFFPSTCFIEFVGGEKRP